MTRSRARTFASLLAGGLAALALSQAAVAAPARQAWVVKPQWVAAEEGFLAGDTLRGRGSATRDEAIAAAYVASQFQAFGLTPAPGMGGFFQTATIIRPHLKGEATLSVGGGVAPGAELLIGSSQGVHGKPVLFTSADVLTMPAAAVVIAASKASPLTLGQTAMSQHVGLLILKESPLTRGFYKAQGGPDIAAYLQGLPAQAAAILTLPAEGFDSLAAQAAGPAAPEVDLVMPPIDDETALTTNVIGYLPGSDPRAGTVIVSAHLDHLGVRPGGVIMHGANDDASGMVAVLELARAMAAAGKPLRKSLLFIGYGSEEIGEYGSKYFAAHPVVPLGEIVANIEFEMIGLQDPGLPKGVMLMTGFERSTLGAALEKHGAPVAADTHPDQHYFERSDNYPVAQAGVVAHTLAGWTAPPTYHQPTDTIANLDLPFMTAAIQSMVGPLRWLADSDFRPRWSPGGQPPK